MALIQLTCLALVIYLCKITEAQSTGRGRNYVPVALVEQCPPCSPSSPRDDLSALLSLARALDSEREWERERQRPVNNCNNVDVDSIITTLIKALVLTTTQNAAGNSYSNGSGYGTKNDGRGGGRNGVALLDLDLLDSDSLDNLLSLRAGGKKLLGVNLGSDGGKEGSGGAVPGLLGGVGGVVDGIL